MTYIEYASTDENANWETASDKAGGGMDDNIVDRHNPSMMLGCKPNSIEKN